MAKEGIYSPQDFQKLSEQVMFPMERPAVLNSFERGISGRDDLPDDLNLANMFDDAIIKKLWEKSWKSMWSLFSNFGIFSAGFVGIYFTFRFIKTFCDTFLHLYALKKQYG